MGIFKTHLQTFVILLISSLTVGAAEVDISKLPPVAAQKPDFVRDIYPIFKEHCVSCHGPEKQKGKYRIDTKEGAFKAGENGASIIPGHSEKSPLIHMVAGLIDEGLMPPPKAEPVWPAGPTTPRL